MEREVIILRPVDSSPVHSSPQPAPTQNRPRKRRWPFVVLGGFLFLMICAIVLVTLATRTPEWYGKGRLTPQQQADAAQKLEEKLAGLGNTLGNQLGSNLGSKIVEQSSSPSTSPAPTTKTSVPSNRVTLILTEAELNGFYRKWMTYDSLDQQLEKYVKTPEIRLMKDQILLGGEVPAAGAIVWGSLDITQRADKPPTVGLGTVYAGSLPIPQTVWKNWTSPLIDQLSKKKGEWVSKAEIWPANPAGVTLGAFVQLRDIHDSKSIEPVFLVRTSLGNKVLPVKVWSLDVQQGVMVAEVEVMTETESRKWLDELKK
jgi:hypothetical protein